MMYYKTNVVTRETIIRRVYTCRIRIHKSKKVILYKVSPEDGQHRLTEISRHLLNLQQFFSELPHGATASFTSSSEDTMESYRNIQGSSNRKHLNELERKRKQELKSRKLRRKLVRVSTNHSGEFNTPSKLLGLRQNPDLSESF